MELGRPKWREVPLFILKSKEMKLDKKMKLQNHTYVVHFLILSSKGNAMLIFCIITTNCKVEVWQIPFFFGTRFR